MPNCSGKRPSGAMFPFHEETFENLPLHDQLNNEAWNSEPPPPAVSSLEPATPPSAETWNSRGAGKTTYKKLISLRTSLKLHP